ncbi:MAG: hypothetical protein ACREBP_00925 [Sphingomicrobium sp.]
MQLARQRLAIDPRCFGRGPARSYALALPAAQVPPISDDVKVFATTFAAGFLFVTVFLA